MVTEAGGDGSRGRCERIADVLDNRARRTNNAMRSSAGGGGDQDRAQMLKGVQLVYQQTILAPHTTRALVTPSSENTPTCL